MRILLCLILIIPISIFGQNDLKNAKQQLSQLKANGIIIRFDTRQKTIDALKEKGFEKQAMYAEKELEAEIREIKSAFENFYTYSPFYYSTSEKLAISTDVLTVTNKDGKEFELDINEKTYYVLNPHRVQSDGFKDFVRGFAVQNIKMENLEKPFPYYIPKHEGLFFLRRAYPELVEVLQEKFTELESKALR